MYCTKCKYLKIFLQWKKNCGACFYPHRVTITEFTRSQSPPQRAGHHQAVRTGGRTGSEHHGAWKDWSRTVASKTVWALAAWRWWCTPDKWSPNLEQSGQSSEKHWCNWSSQSHWSQASPTSLLAPSTHDHLIFNFPFCTLLHHHVMQILYCNHNVLVHMQGRN